MPEGAMTFIVCDVYRYFAGQEIIRHKYLTQKIFNING